MGKCSHQESKSSTGTVDRNTCGFEERRAVDLVQLPGSNCFHLLTPAPRPGGSLAPGSQLQSGGPQEEPRSRRGRERPAFLCQRSSREVGRRGRNPRPTDPKCPGQVAAIVVQFLATAHPFHGCPPGVRREPPSDRKKTDRDPGTILCCSHSL